MNAIFLIWGVIIGFLFFTILDRLSRWISLNNLKKDQENFFTEIKDAISEDSVKFLNRYNHIVNFRVLTKSKGRVDLMLILNKPDIAIFKKGNLIRTTDNTKKQLVDSIIRLLKTKFKKEIEDCVSIYNILIDTKTIEKLGLSVPVKNPLTIDDVLDRISEVGLSNLTDEERRFLDNYQNSQKKK